MIREKLSLTPSEQIEDKTFKTVRDDFEAFFIENFREDNTEEELEEITEEGLEKAKEIAIEQQEKNKEFVEEKCKNLLPVVNTLALPNILKGSPVTLSANGLLTLAIIKYSDAFGTELEFRKYVIERAAFSSTTGDKWRDNYRRNWNLAFYVTKFILILYIMCAFYEIAPKGYERSIEVYLAKREGKGVGDYVKIASGNQELHRLKQKRTEEIEK